jgi:predicted GNAT family acetyltransferase
MITNNTNTHRFEISVDGAEAGFVEYHDHGDVRAFTHTEIDSAFEGRGLASQLIRHVLDDARANGFEVLPFCPFVRSYIAKHDEYVDLVPVDRRAEFDLAA